jgi:hypothetical protein
LNWLRLSDHCRNFSASSGSSVMSRATGCHVSVSPRRTGVIMQIGSPG